MQLEHRDPAYVWDMLRAAREIEQMLGDSDLGQFLSNLTLMRAIERNLEIIGEAARRLSTTFRAAHPDIPWRQVIGQRNILAHEYGQIDHESLFRTASEDVPLLIEELSRIVADLGEPGNQR